MMGHWGYALVTWLCVPMLVYSLQIAWRPLKSRPDFAIGPRIPNTRYRRPIDACALHKVLMDQFTFHQYVQYKHNIPDMKEFTLCAWHKLYNQSADHPIFSYSLPHKPRAILSWVSTTVKKSYYMLAINGHTIYRLIYPMKLNKWYHMCQSWNGKSGEWQLWVNGDRVGRGYYNLMVGKLIKGGGIAISGQEQLGGGGLHNIKGKGSGLQGEITLLQLYKAALTVGKAYTDHSYHHVFANDGDDETTPSPLPPPEAPKDDDGPENNLANENDHPYFENGQLKPILPVNELLARPQMIKSNNIQLSSTFDYGGVTPASIFKIQQQPIYGNIYAPHNFKFIRRESGGGGNNHIDYHIVGKKIEEIRRKRNVAALNNATENNWKPIFINNNNNNNNKELNNNYENEKINHLDDDNNKTHKKRALIVEEHLFSPLEFISNSGISNLHHYSDGHEIPSNNDEAILKYIKTPPDEDPFNYLHSNSILDLNGNKKQYEPAEWEVQKISELCTGCAQDPFRKANVLSWQETPKKLFAGALYISALPKCHLF